MWAGSLADRRIRRAVDALRADPACGDPVAPLAARVGLSRSRFYDLFARCTGLSPGVYCDMLRVEEAVRRLAKGGDPIRELSADLGFSSQGNFTRFFVRHVGVAPSRYRRAIAHMDAA
jgi:AraC-like DNA-binding protein